MGRMFLDLKLFSIILLLTGCISMPQKAPEPKAFLSYPWLCKDLHSSATGFFLYDCENIIDGFKVRKITNPTNILEIYD